MNQNYFDSSENSNSIQSNLEKNWIINEEKNTNFIEDKAYPFAPKKESLSIIENIPMLREDSKYNEHQDNNFLPVIYFFSMTNRLQANYNQVINGCPRINNFLSNSNKVPNEVKITLPDWITIKNLQEYFIYICDDKFSNYTIPLRKLLFIADYFENFPIVDKIILSEILPYLNKENSLNYLEDSFLKLQAKTTIQTWFKLFYSSLYTTAKYFTFYLEFKLDKIKKLNKKILEELIEKFLFLLHNDKLEPIQNENFMKIIYDLICQLRGATNINDLVSQEYFRLISEDSMDEILSAKPTFTITFPRNCNNTYKEIDKVSIECQEFYFFIVSKNNQAFHLYYKLKFPFTKVNNFKMLSVISIVNFKENIELMQTSCNIIISGKHLNEVYRLNEINDNFEKEIKEIGLQVYLRIAYTHSAILNFYLKNFASLSNDHKISQLSKKQFLALIQSLHLGNIEEIRAVEALSNWLLEEKNINDEVQSIIESINWKNVNLIYLFEFIIKFYGIIEKLNLLENFMHFLENRISFEISREKSISSKKSLNNSKENSDEKSIAKLVADVLLSISKIKKIQVKKQNTLNSAKEFFHLQKFQNSRI